MFMEVTLFGLPPLQETPVQGVQGSVAEVHPDRVPRDVNPPARAFIASISPCRVTVSPLSTPYNKRMHIHTTKALLTLCRVISLRLEKHPLCFVEFFFLFFKQKKPAGISTNGGKSKGRGSRRGGVKTQQESRHTHKKNKQQMGEKENSGEKVSSEN